MEKSLPNYKVSESGISFLFASACRLKIPRLVVLIKELGPVNPDSAAKFKDPSGEIRGVIHQNAFESDTVGPLLVPGSILELVDLSVIKPTKQTRHLNVTLQNINSVYLANGERHFCHHNKRPEENKESVLANLESFSDVF